ncbi:MAG TPA: hypothetical protein VFE58_19310 [Tepidisphaeraceae bacterium]|jgi:hypothetical protein|nr:hypothetical protein [Tepidisphaeraceae bacterium]
MTTVTTSSNPKVPLSERINIRMIVFASVVLLLIGTPVYIYLDSVLSGGIHHHGDIIEVDLKAMSNFPFDQQNGTINDIPKEFRDLDGKRVQVQGEIYAPDSASENIDHFDLVYSIAKCCFAGPPQIQHFVHSKVKDGGTVPYMNGLVQAVGILKVDVKHDEKTGKVSQVYAMQIESVKQL